MITMYRHSTQIKSAVYSIRLAVTLKCIIYILCGSLKAAKEGSDKHEMYATVWT
jgi:hypothetical protein